MKKGKILFIDDLHPFLQEQLTQHGFVCDIKLNISQSELIKILPEYLGLAVRSKIKITKEIIESGKQLHFIARAGSGMENIDLKAAEHHGISCLNSPEGNRDAVAEHTIGMLLALFNHLKRGDEEIRKGIWKREKNRGVELHGKTVGIIGFGMMGQAVAERLKGFGVRVMAHDKYKSGFGNPFIEESTVEELQMEADIISLHLPLAEDTYHYANTFFFSAFRKPIYLINTSRGAVVSTDALAKAIEQKKVAGACLDVLEYEKLDFESLDEKELPPDFVFLLKNDHVIFSPHVAGWTHESYQKHSIFLWEKIKKVLQL